MKNNKNSKLIRLSGETLKAIIEMANTTKRTYRSSVELLIDIGLKYYNNGKNNFEKINRKSNDFTSNQ